MGQGAVHPKNFFGELKRRNEGNQAGMQTVEGQADGAMRAEYSYNLA